MKQRLIRRARIRQPSLQGPLESVLDPKVGPANPSREIFSDDDLLSLRENLLIESVKSAFGESRGGRKRKPSDEAWAWIIADDHTQPFSFHHCCLSCGVDPDKMRDWLHYYQRKLLR